MLKGEESFWYPFFQVINLSDLPMHWSNDELTEFQDAVLKQNIINYREEFDIEWEEVYKVFKDNKYDHILPGVSDPENEEIMKKKYTEAFESTVTRCFGWGLPCTTMVPFADCINHHNVDSSYEMIRKDWKPMSVDERS